MFGKGKAKMTGNDKFVMAKGRANGNIKQAAAKAMPQKAPAQKAKGSK